MAKEATVGLMIWDGKSIGPLLNVYRLLDLGKNAVVYSVANKLFIEFKHREEWDKFLAHCDHHLRDQVERRAALERPVARQPVRTALQI